MSLPSKISSQHSKDDAHELACNLGIEYHVLGISEAVAAAQFTLAKPFEGLEPDVTEETCRRAPVDFFSWLFLINTELFYSQLEIRVS